MNPKQAQQYMSQAIELAKKGLYSTHPNPRVGCIIVKNNHIIGTGFHQQTGEPHAEIYALKEAKGQAVGSDVYITLEPCSHFGKTPPCVDALIKANVKRVFIANLDPNPLVSGSGIKKLKKKGIIVYSGLMAKNTYELNKGFFKRMKSNKPFVWLKVAMSLDGKTAMASGESKWITSSASRRDVQKLRARSSAILTGIGTIIYDDPSMNVRIKNTYIPSKSIKQPLRVILDSKGQLVGNEKIFSIDGNILIYTKNNKLEIKSNVVSKVEIVYINDNQKHLNLNKVILDLGKREINELHIECGSTLGGAFLKAGLVDELLTYIAPKLMGSDAISLFKLPLTKLSESINLKIKQVDILGSDLKVISKVINLKKTDIT